MNFSNASFTTNASDSGVSTATSAAAPGVIITVAVLAIVGNLLVLSVTAKRQTFPSATRLFVASMALSDLIQGLVLPVFVEPAQAGEWVYSDRAAKATAAILLSSIHLSALALAGLTLDRHYALRNDGVGVSRKKARIFLISAWVGTYACVFHKSFRRAVKEIATSVASYLYDKCCPKNRVDNDDQQNIQMSSL
ncbi:beta-3 adrenergic receptor-like [Branchiostoma floridae]|uniref:Beta-3 adrenergic receptor-like n=1 Tax=Branchiostoma floridae TaxID=7739 RepID=A0A9J7LIJ3_BRAFL|nr:beta-3 adrenergic receptor-like [Branchiostoma floridae]